MRDPASGVTADVDLFHTGLTRTDRATGTIYANSSQGPISVGVDEPAAALARIVQRRNQTDPDDDGPDNAGAAGAFAGQDASDSLDPATARARLAYLQSRIESYGGAPQRLEAAIAAMQAGLSGSDPDDPGTELAWQRLVRLREVLAQWNQDHPGYSGLSREQSALQARVQAQQDAQDQSDAQIKASLANPETVRMNGALPLDPMPALGAGDVSLADIQQRAGDLAGQKQLPPSAALRAALVEARNGGATTVGGADINDAIRSISPAQILPSAFPSPNPAPSGLSSFVQDAWGRAKDFGAALEQGVTRPIAGILGAIAVGSHLIRGTALNETDGKKLADDLNSYWSQARNPEDADSVLSQVTGGAAPLIPMLLVGRFGGSRASELFNAISMGGEAMLEAKEKGWSDSEAMEMFALNFGMGFVGGRIISRSLNRINALTNGALSKYLLALAQDKAPNLVPVIRAGLAPSQSAVEGGLFGAVQTFGSEAWAKLRNFGNSGQREWSDIWNDAKTSGVQNALLMALTTIFAAGALPAAQRQFLAKPNQNGAPPVSQPPAKPGSSPTSEPSAKPPILPGAEPGSAPPSTPEKSPEPASGPANSKPAGPKPGGSEPATPPPVPAEDNSSPPPDEPAPPDVKSLAKRVTDLHDQATDLRNKIAAAHDDGDPEAIGDLGDHLDAEKDTQDRFHKATQDLLDTVPEGVRSRIERAAGGRIDYDAIRAKNREDPTHSFATMEIGNALRDQYLSDEKQRGIRRWSERQGVDPALADRVADQAVGAKAIHDLGGILRREPVEPEKAGPLKQLGLLEEHPAPDGSSHQTVTDDALPLLPKGMQKAAAKQPKRLPVSHTEGPPANGLNRLVDGGRQRIAETAKAIQSPSTRPLVHKTLPLTPSTKLRQINLRAAGFREHHIISDKNSATKNHTLLKLAGFNLESQANKMWLPTDPALHPTRSIHDGKHLRGVSSNLAHLMKIAVESGQKNGWTQTQYAEALKAIIKKERILLRSGKRALNKNARPNAI